MTIELAHEHLRVVIDPVGARVESMHWGEALIVDDVWSQERSTQYRGCLLAPWPNRVADGRWEWQGRSLSLPVNESATNSALHGLVHDVEFLVQQVRPQDVTLSHLLRPSEGYPFRLLIEVHYELGPNGLGATITAQNVGDEDAPIGLGVHPYFAAPSTIDEVVLHLPAATQPVNDEQWQEVGRRPAEGEYDFSKGRAFGALAFDDAWTDLTGDEDGWATALLERPDGIDVQVWMGATADWVTVYTPPDRGSVSVEPQTCGANALRSGIDLEIVAPGDSLQLEWACTVGRR